MGRSARAEQPAPLALPPEVGEGQWCCSELLLGTPVSGCSQGVWAAVSSWVFTAGTLGCGAVARFSLCFPGRGPVGGLQTSIPSLGPHTLASPLWLPNVFI